ncbi:FecR domain-containing protein [Pseudomonas sp. NPDC088890]|uniref:FecR domain-containing protein n=1 Tax=Pseudomonas sp. NPDC088890 TaxID=3364458 RepID=UPI003850E645
MISKQRLALPLAILALIGAAALLGSPWMNQPFELADLRTSNDQQLTRQLEDGSLLHLAADSAVDIEFDPVQRRLTMLQGSLSLHVSATDSRPFTLITEHGTLATQNANLKLERDAKRSHITLLDGSAELDSAGQRLHLNAGQQLRFDQSGPEHPHN